MKQQSIRILTQIPSSVHMSLKHIADMRSESVAVVVREALREYVQKNAIGSMSKADTIEVDDLVFDEEA